MSNSALFWLSLKLLARKGHRVSLEYDIDFGLEKRTGWSLKVDGRVMIAFAQTPEEAVLSAMVIEFVRNEAIIEEIPPEEPSDA